jgi:GNAT superfamily N-acetyltransferase
LRRAPGVTRLGAVEIRAVRSDAELAEAWAFLEGFLPQVQLPGYPRSLAFYRDRLPEEAGLTVVARDPAGEVAGAALASVDGDRVLLGEVAVAEAYRGHGIGSRLVERVATGAAARGVAELLVGAADDGAARFYARNGFTAWLFLDCHGGPDAVARRERLLATRLASHRVEWRGGDERSARVTVACDGVDVALRDEVAALLGDEGHAGFVMSRRSAPVVEAVHRSAEHTLRKGAEPVIRLLAGLGVEGDAHMGSTVRHRSRVARDPRQPNLRQVHLIAAELHDELRVAGFTVGAGEMGENVTTRGIDLLALPAGTRLGLGPDAVVEITGLRTPCRQLERLQKGLLGQVLVRTEAGETIRKAGVMAVVVAGGDVSPGDPIAVELPAPPHRRSAPV